MTERAFTEMLHGYFAVEAMFLIASDHNVPCSLGAVLVWVLVAPENLNADQRALPSAAALTCAVASFVYRLRRRAKQRRLDRIIIGEPAPPSAWECFLKAMQTKRY